MVCFQMVGTIAMAIAKPNNLKTGPFEIQPLKSPDFKWLDFRSGCYRKSLRLCGGSRERIKLHPSQTRSVLKEGS